MKRSCSESESGVERNGRPSIFNVNTIPSPSTKSYTGFGAEISKIFNRISKRGDSKASKPNSDHRKSINLPQLLIIPSRRHSTADNSYSKKFSLLIPIQKSNTEPTNSFSNGNNGIANINNERIFGKTAARPQSFSVAQDFTGPADIYGQESYLQRKGGSIRKGFRGYYARSSLSPHIEDVFTPEEEELFEVEKLDDNNDNTITSDNDTITSDNNTIISDNTSNTSTIVEKCQLECDDSDDDISSDLSFFSCPNVNDAILSRRHHHIIERLIEHQPEVFEYLKEEEDEMRKVKASLVDSKKDDSPQRRGHHHHHHFQLNVKDDPRKTIFDQVGLKRHSLSQAAMRTSGRYERFDSACLLTNLGGHDDDDANTSSSSFRSSMPIVASHVIKDFGSRDRVLGNSDSTNQILRHHHHHHHNVHDFPTNNNSAKRITFDQLPKFRSSNFSAASSGDSNPNLNLEKTYKLVDDPTNSSKNNLVDSRTLPRTDADNYVRFRDMKDARRKFFESDTSLRSNHESHGTKNPFLGLRPKSSATLTSIGTSSPRHSVDVSNRHQSFLSQLSYEPKLLKEEEKERKKISPRCDKFDKRFSASMITVNGNENGNALPGYALRNYDDPHRVDDWRTIRLMDQYSQKKTSIPIKHHRKRESLDSGFDMRMEDATTTTTSYPASEDSLNSASSPDSYNRYPVFSPPHTKNMNNGPSNVANWFVISSPKPYHHAKNPQTNNSAMYSSMSVSSTTFSYQTTRRKFSTIPRGVTLPSISIFQLSEQKICPTIMTLKEIAEDLRSVEMELIAYAVAILNSHEEKTKVTPSLVSDDEVKKSSPESHLTFHSPYTPNFLGDPILLSCFHVKEFFPKFFLDKFPWQPMSCYSFDDKLIKSENNNAHDNTLTEDNCDDDDDDAAADDDDDEDHEQLDYPEIRKKLDDLTRMQIEQLRKLRNFLEENLKNSKEKRNQAYLKMQSKLTEKERERCQNFSNESDKILKLLILLSQRVSKHHEENSKSKKSDANSGDKTETCESDFNTTDSEKIVDRQNSPAKKRNLKLSELESRLADARNLKDSIEKRGNVLHEILSFRDLDESDIREFFDSTGENFIMSLILLWTLERNKMASEFLLGLEKLAEDESKLMKLRDRKKRRRNKVSEIMKKDVVGGGDDDDDDDGEHNRL